MEELTRDVRTVFVGQLQVRVKEKDIKRFFKKVGGVKVNDIELIRDKYTQRSKGFAYVELRSLDDVPKALLLNGQRFQFKKGRLGYPVLVKASEAEKNYAWGVEKKNEAQSAKRLLISNIHLGVSEDDLRTVLEPFGGIVRLELARDAEGRSVGQCVVEFRSASMAERVASKIKGIELAGMTMDVRREIEVLAEAKEKEKERERNAAASPVPTTAATVGDTNSHAPQNDVMAAVGAAMSNASVPTVPTVVARTSSNWRLDSGANTTLDAAARARLMQNLAGNDSGIVVPTRTVLPPQPKPVVAQRLPPVGDPSSCMVVQNMFDPAEEEGDAWDKEIEEDVLEECSKYGHIKHCFVDKNSRGYVYLMFDSMEAGRKCGFDLCGRYFNKKQLSVQFFPAATYTAKFGL